jgi:hypothetical protein
LEIRLNLILKKEMLVGTTNGGSNSNSTQNSPVMIPFYTTDIPVVNIFGMSPNEDNLLFPELPSSPTGHSPPKIPITSSPIHSFALAAKRATPKKESEELEEGGWKLDMGDISINSENLTFTGDIVPRLKKGGKKGRTLLVSNGGLRGKS